MKIVESNSVSEGKWREMLECSDDVWLYHTCPWLEFTAQVYSAENHFWIAEENGKWVGGFPIQLIRGVRFGKPSNQAYSTRMGSTGPFTIRGIDSNRRQDILKELTRSAVEWARGMNVENLSCSLPPLARSNLNAARGINPLLLAGWRDISTQTRIADLTRPEPELWSDLAYDARRSVKHASSAGYSVERICWKDALEDYYRIHVETYTRTGVAPHPKAYFEGIAQSIAQTGGAVLWVARDPKERPVAFHNCARFRGTSLYWTGCCQTDHLQSGVNYLLFWEALKGAREDGCQWYEIGEVFPDQSSGKLKGLTDFKKKFGGELYRYFRGEIRIFDPLPPSFTIRAENFLKRLVKDIFHN